MRAFKTFVGHVCFYTKPTKGTKSTKDCRQVNAEKLTKPARNRQNLKKADKISLKSHEKTDNELYISGCAFSGDWGQGAESGQTLDGHRRKDRPGPAGESAEKRPVLNLAGKRAKRGVFSNKKWCFPVYLGFVKSL